MNSINMSVWRWGYTRLKEEEKVVGKGCITTLPLKFYNGYDVAGQLLFTIEFNVSLNYQL